jgi:hypothetical protein
MTVMTYFRKWLGHTANWSLNLTQFWLIRRNAQVVIKPRDETSGGWHRGPGVSCKPYLVPRFLYLYGVGLNKSPWLQVGVRTGS